MFRQFTFLGTSSGVPTQFRNVSAACLKLSDNRILLVDCGEGTQHQFLRTPNVSISKVDTVFLTHLHGDHCFGLPGLMCSIGLLWAPPGVVPSSTFALKKRKAGGDNSSSCSDSEIGSGSKENSSKPSAVNTKAVEEVVYDPNAPIVYDHYSRHSQYFTIYGPPRTAAYIRGVLRACEVAFGFQYRVVELQTADLEKKIQEASVIVNAPLAPVEPSDTTTQWRNTLSEEQPLSVNEELHPSEAPPVALRPLPDSNGTLFRFPLPGGLTVLAALLSHPLPSLGYCFEEPPTPGTLDAQRCKELGVPAGPLLAKLKKGESVTVTLKDGSTRVVRSEEVLGPAQRGRRFVSLGDTCDSTNMVSLVQSVYGGEGSDRHSLVDWLVHEATFDDQHNSLALPRGHSTARMAGACAAAMGARHLVLSHFSARFPPPDKDAACIAQLLSEAVAGLASGREKQAANNSSSSKSEVPAAEQCVIAAVDFLSIDLSRVKEAKKK